MYIDESRLTARASILSHSHARVNKFDVWYPSFTQLAELNGTIHQAYLLHSLSISFCNVPPQLHKLTKKQQCFSVWSFFGIINGASIHTIWNCAHILLYRLCSFFIVESISLRRHSTWTSKSCRAASAEHHITYAFPNQDLQRAKLRFIAKSEKIDWLPVYYY